MDRSRPKYLRSAVFAGLALLLCWATATHSFVAGLASFSPRRAAALRPSDPYAAVAFVDEQVNWREGAGQEPAPAAQDSSAEARPALRQAAPALDSPVLRASLRRAFQQTPLDARLFRLLGQLALLEKDAVGADAPMRRAARLSLHEVGAIDWVMRKSLETKDYAQAAGYAGVLLNNDPKHLPSAGPVLARLAEQKAGLPHVEKLLAAAPDWRADFFAGLPNYVADARTPFRLMIGLKGTAAPPTQADIDAYLNFLAKHKFYEFAYYAWLQFLPPERLPQLRAPNNGDFAAPPAAIPFDWRIVPGTGYGAGVEPREDDPANRALNIEFGRGRAEFAPIVQTLMLAPGAYVLNGEYLGGAGAGRGLRWSVACLDGALLGGANSFSRKTQNWTVFSASFVVPEDGCRPQFVRLDSSAPADAVSFDAEKIAFDNLAIERVAPQPASAPSPAAVAPTPNKSGPPLADPAAHKRKPR